MELLAVSFFFSFFFFALTQAHLLQLQGVTQSSAGERQSLGTSL